MSADIRRRNRAIQDELVELQRLNLISAAQRQQIGAGYPSTTTDLLNLIRWFSILGGVGAGLGLLLLLGQNMNLFALIEGGCTLLFFGLLALARWMKQHKAAAAPSSEPSRLYQTARALELVACFALTALTLTVGKQHDTGSGHWSALFGLDLLVLMPLAYVLKNRLVLIYACVDLFVFFGGETGYVSGWGMYWLGMNYPLRFLIAGLTCIGIGWLHSSGQVPALRAYALMGRVYQHFGMLVVNLALWFFALFGYFNGIEKYFSRGTATERLLFSVLWAAFCGSGIYIGLKRDLSILRTYGLVFLLINLYTFYFQFIVFNSGELWFLHMLLIGGSLTYLGLTIERSQRSAATPPSPTPDPELAKLPTGTAADSPPEIRT